MFPHTILGGMGCIIEMVFKTNNEKKQKNLDTVIEHSKQKGLRRGGFAQKIFLEKTISKE